MGTWRLTEKCKGEEMSGVGEKSGLGHQCQQMPLVLLTGGLGAHKLNADEQAEMVRLCIKGRKFKYLSSQSCIKTAGVSHQPRGHCENKTGSRQGASHHPLQG